MSEFLKLLCPKLPRGGVDAVAHSRGERVADNFLAVGVPLYRAVEPVGDFREQAARVCPVGFADVGCRNAPVDYAVDKRRKVVAVANRENPFVGRRDAL